MENGSGFRSSRYAYMPEMEVDCMHSWNIEYWPLKIGRGSSIMLIFLEEIQ